MPFFVLSHFQGWATAFRSSASWPCLHFQHYDCIACWEIARIFDRVLSFPHFFMFILSPQPLRPITEISQLLRFPVVVSSKICYSRSRNSSLVESHRNFDSEWPFFQFHEEQAKFANIVHHLTCFFEKVDSSLPSCLMMFIRQPPKMKLTVPLPKIAYKPYTWAIILAQQGKMTTS